jgi:hypothetical protein
MDVLHITITGIPSQPPHMLISWGERVDLVVMPPGRMIIVIGRVEVELHRAQVIRGAH